jgi:uncharacterized protein DUF5597
MIFWWRARDDYHIRRRGSGKGHCGSIDSIWEGSFVNSAWVPGRNLNGDDDNQGRYLRMPAGKFTIQRVRLYQYH